jgi:hypothetical protein
VPNRSSAAPPLPPDVRFTVSSRLLLRAARQPQFAALAVIVNVPVPAVPPLNVSLGGAIWNVQPHVLDPAWLIVTVFPAIVAVPVRADAPGLAATVARTRPFP